MKWSETALLYGDESPHGGVFAVPKSRFGGLNLRHKKSRSVIPFYGTHDACRLRDGDAEASTLLISTKGRLRHRSMNGDSEIPLGRSLIEHRSQGNDE